MRLIETHINIAAPAGTVWQALTDFPSYARDNWNEYIRSIAAPLVRGGRVTAVTHTPRLGQRDLKATLVNVDLPELSWEVKLPVPGLLHATHYFRAEALSPASTRFVQGERVSGVLTGLVFHLVEKSEAGFHTMNEALKRRAEGRR
ncbi:SRPBCC family protein [Dactylosporangium sp. CA-092794]|uniref:SRPBCC family protein n=1 Tax=Dactylosporangium sp. CA-092794 TaxID=3239929 RepID=UPI003D940ABA